MFINRFSVCIEIFAKENFLSRFGSLKTGHRLYLHLDESG